MDAPRRKTTVPRRRLAGYGCVLLLGVFGAGSLHTSALDDLQEVIQQVRADDGSASSFHHNRAALNLFPGRGFTLTLDTRGMDRFRPAWFLTLTELDGERGAEIIFAGGETGVMTLGGAKLEAYLAQAEFSLAELRAVYTTHCARYAALATEPKSAPAAR